MYIYIYIYIYIHIYIYIYIHIHVALYMTRDIDCYRVGAVPNLNPKPSSQDRRYPLRTQ